MQSSCSYPTAWILILLTTTGDLPHTWRRAVATSTCCAPGAHGCRFEVQDRWGNSPTDDAKTHQHGCVQLLRCGGVVVANAPRCQGRHDSPCEQRKAVIGCQRLYHCAFQFRPGKFGVHYPQFSWIQCFCTLMSPRHAGWAMADLFKRLFSGVL